MCHFFQKTPGPPQQTFIVLLVAVESLETERSPPVVIDAERLDEGLYSGNPTTVAYYWGVVRLYLYCFMSFV